MEELSQHLLDIAVNSLEAGATELEITIREDTGDNTLQFQVLDNGRGIAAQDIPKLLDPFYTTKKHKRVGLGIPLLREAVDRCGGALEIMALPRKGTAVTVTFPYDHLDLAPLGDVAGTLTALLAGNQGLDLIYRHQYNGEIFIFTTREFKSLLKGIPLQTPEVLVWLKNYLANQVKELRRKANEKLGRTG